MIFAVLIHVGFAIDLPTGSAEKGSTEGQTGWNASRIEASGLDKGIVFIKKGSFLLSGDKWTLIVEVPFIRYRTVVASFLAELQTFEGFLHDEIWPRFQPGPHSGSSKDPQRNDTKLLEDLLMLLSREVEQMKKGIQEVISTLNRLQETVAVPNRERRSALIGIGGKILKFLFGTAEEDDLKDLSDAIDQVNLKADTAIHLAHLQASALDATNANVERDAKAIRKLAQTTGTLIEQVKGLQYQLIMDQRESRRWIITFSLLSTAARMLQSSFSEIHNNVNGFAQALDVTARRQLSPFFVSPGMFLKLLKEIQLLLPADMTFVTSLRLEDMYIYYHWTEVKAAAKPGALRLFISIPLKSMDNYFDYYHAIPFPAHIPTLNLSVVIDPENPYIAVSSNRQAFFEMDADEMEGCMQGPLVICQPNIAIRKSPENSCLYSLLMQQNVFPSNLCTRRILRHTQPYFYRMDESGKWAFSVPDPVHLTVRCPKDQGRSIRMTSDYDSHTEIIRGTGILQLKPECSAHAPNLVLPSSYMGRSNFENFTLESNLVIPKVSDVLTPIELSNVYQAINDSVFDMLHLNANEVANLEHLRSGIDIEELQQGLNLRKGILQNTFKWYDERLFIASIIVSSVMILLYVLWNKLKKNVKGKWVPLPFSGRMNPSAPKCPTPSPEVAYSPGENEVDV